MLEDVVRTAAFARLPLRVRRSAVRSWWRIRDMAGRGPQFGLEPVFRQVLRVSSAEARRLQREVAFQDLIAVTGWATLLQASRASFDRDLADVTLSGGDILAQVARDRRPVILAPLHMGSFALPFVRMMQDYFPDRRMLILRARQDRPEETAAMQRIGELGIEMRFLNVSQKQAYLDAVRFARGGAVIVSFVDLPASYGSPVPVSLFGRPTRIAMGLNSLARVTEATVVPLAVESAVEGDTVRFGRPFESYRTGPDEKARVAELIRRHIEEQVLAGPDQWHMWPRFHEFLDAGERQDAAA